jgi:hypothetical protein
MINSHINTLIRLLLFTLIVALLTACQFKPSGPCDSNITFNSVNPLEAAKALGICDGLVSAQWELPDGTIPTSEIFAVGHGVLADFGVENPVREGSMLLALSSGTARRPLDADYVSPSSRGYDKGYTHEFPQASNTTFPVNAVACPMPLEPHDGISLSITIVVPRGVIGYSFDFDYFTADYPDSICAAYSDQAAVIVTDKNLSNKNVLLYGNQNPVTSQTVEYIICEANHGVSCPLGGIKLDKTGFDRNGATDWNTVTVQATSGDTIILKFMVWDSGDGLSDTTILFDNFKWLTQ